MSSDQAGEPGLRSRAGGKVLSSGCNDLDQLCGGGLALGSLVIVLEDEWRAHSSTILSYFMAEGVLCQQQMLYFSNDPTRKHLSDRLPAHSQKGPTQDKASDKRQQGADTDLKIAWQYRRYIKPSNAQTTRSRPQQSSFRPKAATSSALRSAKTTPWAHQFDLSKRCQPELLARASESVHCLPEQPGTLDPCAFRSAAAAAADLVQRVQRAASGQSDATSATPVATAVPRGPQTSGRPADSTVTPTGGSQPASPTVNPTPTSTDPGPSTERSATAASSFTPGARRRLPSGGPAAGGPPRSVQTAAEALPTFSPKSVGRIAIESAGGEHWPGCGSKDGAQWLLSMLMAVKAAVRDSRCVAMVSVAADLYGEAVLPQLLHCADVALRLQSLADDAQLVTLAAEPHSAAGLLQLCKFSVPGCISLPVCEPMLLLLRHRRTRIALVPIEIDPDAEMDFAEAATTLASSSSSLLCQSSKPQPAADF
eukprot:jgi/Ulvmu1/10114/UM006_0065.1